MTALVGGDLYEVVETDSGVRVILGDVRGKGMEAVQMAATVLAAFRRVAVTAPSLTAAARHLDDVVKSVARAKREANAQLVAPRDGAREQQVGDVGAGNQQHEANDDEDCQERLFVACP